MLMTPIFNVTAVPALPEAARGIVAHQEEFWRACEKPAESITSRDLFAYALALCEARQYPERLDRLFALAEQMQDRNPKSKTYGNFWWALRDGKVLDNNAVEFAMRGGTLLWLKHRDFIPATARPRLESILNFAVQGSSHHKVATSYSNIAIMNAGNLILLGEMLGKPPVADEGYARLDRFFRYTQASGLHEFDSPTYLCPDLDGLGMTEAFCQREAGRAQARALLQLLWSDVALNWFPPAQKLAGAQSRSYDYLYGLGELDRLATLNGLLNAPVPTEVDAIYSMEVNWHPPQADLSLSTQFPRLVRQSWGPDWWESRTHFLQADITLSCTAASYAKLMDMPLTVDLPGDRKSVRGYFIADGRDDPYGRNRIADGAHKRAFHLNPFWTAAQRNGDALALAIYRDKDIPSDATTLVSDFVMPMDVDSFWIDDRRIDFSKSQPSSVAIKPGEVVSLRKGTAALGLRVAWSRGLDGREAPSILTYDGNKFGAVRLAVEHVAEGQRPVFSGVNPGAAFWLRVGSALKTDEEFSRWRRQFAAADAQVQATADAIRMNVTGADGPVSLAASAPWSEPESLEPRPTRSVLELDGVDIGQKILSSGSMP
jgi:hypothetical protein